MRTQSAVGRAPTIATVVLLFVACLLSGCQPPAAEKTADGLPKKDAGAVASTEPEVPADSKAGAATDAGQGPALVPSAPGAAEPGGVAAAPDSDTPSSGELATAAPAVGADGSAA
ncbi:MAG: hypothetical protein ACOY3P_13370, partial [Planctomycetota bacterium]